MSAYAYKRKTPPAEKADPSPKNEPPGLCAAWGTVRMRSSWISGSSHTQPGSSWLPLR